MNVRDTSSIGDRLMCQIWYVNVKAKKVTARTWRHVKTYKFDIKVKGQLGIGILNVCDTSSPYTIYDMPIFKQVTSWKQICSNTRTEAFRKDKRTDRVTLYPPSFVHGGGGVLFLLYFNKFLHFRSMNWYINMAQSFSPSSPLILPMYTHLCHTEEDFFQDETK